MLEFTLNVLNRNRNLEEKLKGVSPEERKITYYKSNFIKAVDMVQYCNITIVGSSLCIGNIKRAVLWYYVIIIRI